MLSYLSIFYVIFLSLAKVIYFFDIRKQFITFFNRKSNKLLFFLHFSRKNALKLRLYAVKSSKKDLNGYESKTRMATDH